MKDPVDPLLPDHKYGSLLEMLHHLSSYFHPNHVSATHILHHRIISHFCHSHSGSFTCLTLRMASTQGDEEIPFLSVLEVHFGPWFHICYYRWTQHVTARRFCYLEREMD